MWSFPYLNRPARGQRFTAQQAAVVDRCSACVCARVCLVSACFCVWQTQGFSCVTRHITFPWVKKYSPCSAHLLGAGEKSKWGWLAQPPLSADSHMSNFQPSNKVTLCFIFSPCNPHLKPDSRSRWKWHRSWPGRPVGCVWSAKALDAQRWVFYPFRQTQCWSNISYLLFLF